MRTLLFVGLVLLVAILLAGPVLGSTSSAIHGARVPDQATPTATATSTATTTPSITLTATASPSPSSTATASPSPPPAVTATPTGTTIPPRVYLPLILRNDYVPPQTPTPTPTLSAPTFIRNGDFEDGNQDWVEFSQRGFRIILHEDELLEDLAPHSGDWAVWLGGADNELAAVYQAVTVAADRPYVSYWIWIASEDSCEHDFGGLGFAYGEDEFEGLDIYWLCEDNNTGGWINQTVSAADFVGQEVELWILAETDGTLNSNLFVDDVAFVSSGAAAAQHRLDDVGADPRSSRRLADMVDRIGSMSPTR